jgi:hypothetical protein
MYKNIEVLDKKKHAKLSFDTIVAQDIAKGLGYVPVGVNEILDMSAFAPVVITNLENGEFAAFTGINNEINIYNSQGSYIPLLALGYPFFNVVVKDEQENLNDVIAIDKSEFVGEKKANKIFNKKQELEEQASQKISIIRELNRQRDISRKIVQELKSKDLLVKKDFRINVEGKEQVILEEFYIINRDKLNQLDDATLATWAKKGWMGIIDAHTKSINNFQKALQR